MHVSTVHFIVSCLELCIIVVACFVFTSIIVLRLHVTITVCLNNNLSLKRGKREKEKYMWMHLLPLVLFFCHRRTCGLPLCLYLFIFLRFPFLVFMCMPVLCMHVSMCMFLCVCSRLCIYVLSICVHVCVHVCLFTSVSVCVYVFMHVCTCAHAQSPGLLLGVFPLICHLTHWRQDLSITPIAHWYSMHDRSAFSRDPLPQPPQVQNYRNLPCPPCINVDSGNSNSGYHAGAALSCFQSPQIQASIWFHFLSCLKMSYNTFIQQIGLW